MDDAKDVLTRHKLDVRDYYRMVDAGILSKYDRVELIEGEIIDMAPTGQGHMGMVNGLTRALVIACGENAVVSVQNSVHLGRWSAPEPDFAVFRPRADLYRTGTRPGPAETLLVVEIADSSLRYDLTVKLPLYAQSNTPEVWIVDVQDQVLHAYRLPRHGEYTEQSSHRAGESIALSMAPNISVPLNVMFG